MAPGYQSYGWTTQDWRSIKVNNKGDIDYSQKCGAEGTKTPSGSPRLCLPAAVVKSLIRTDSGKEVIRKQARKKARAKKGERVPWHPRIKKIWKRIEDKTVKDKPNPPLYVHPDKAEKWSERYEKITAMTGEELLDLANKLAEEKGLKVELGTYKQDTEKLQRGRKDFPLPPKYEKLYQKFLESKTGVDIRLYRGNTLVDELGFSLIEESTKELFEYLKQRKRLPPNRAHLPYVCQVYQRKGEKRYLHFKTFFVTAATQPKNRFPISVGGGGGFEMSEGQQGKGYYGIIKTYQAGFLEANNIEAFGDGISPMRVDLYQSYGWLSAYSYKDNYPYASRAAEYYLNLHGTTKKPNKDSDYFSVYRPVYSRKMTGAAYRAGVKNMLETISNPHHEDTHPLFPADLPPDFEPDFPDAEEDSEDNPSDVFYSYEYEAIEAAQKLANETGRKQNVMAILHMEEDGYSETEYEITEEDVFDGPSNWLVKTLEPEKTRDNPSEWRHGEFAEEDPFEEYF